MLCVSLSCEQRKHFHMLNNNSAHNLESCEITLCIQMTVCMGVVKRRFEGLFTICLPNHIAANLTIVKGHVKISHTLFLVVYPSPQNRGV